MDLVLVRLEITYHQASLTIVTVRAITDNHIGLSSTTP